MVEVVVVEVGTKENRRVEEGLDEGGRKKVRRKRCSQAGVEERKEHKTVILETRAGKVLYRRVY